MHTLGLTDGLERFESAVFIFIKYFRLSIFDCLMMNYRVQAFTSSCTFYSRVCSFHRLDFNILRLEPIFIFEVPAFKILRQQTPLSSFVAFENV